MQTYVIAWIDPQRKLESRIDLTGLENPTWNDKFVFMIDEKMLHNLNAALVFEIYCVQHVQKDKLIGIAQVLLDSLVGCSNRYHEGMQGTFRAYQIRRPSGEPQGILNIGVTILDGLCYHILSEFVHKKPGVDHNKLMGGASKDVKKGCIREMVIGFKWFFCGLVPEKTKMKKKVYQWPNEM